MIDVSCPSLRADDAYTPGLPRDVVARRYGIPPEDVAKLGSAEKRGCISGEGAEP